MVLRQSIGREHMRILLRSRWSVRIAFDFPDLGRRVALLLVNQVLDRRLIWLIVSRHRAVFQSFWHEEPSLAVPLHDEGRGAVMIIQSDAVRLKRRIGRLG